MSDIINFKLTVADCVRIAKEAYENGDIERNIVYLYKALSLRPNRPDLLLMLADAYSSINAYTISNNLLYVALAKRLDESLKEEICVRLAMNFLELEKYDVAEYYMRDYADDFDFDIPEREEGGGKGLYISYPKGEDYYESLVERAYQLISEQKMLDALAVLDEIPEDSAVKPTANHVALVCIMMLDDIDGVIENATRMLRGEYSLSVACSLATAYLMENKRDEAQRVIDDILSRKYDDPEDVVMLIPLLVNMDMKEEIISYVDVAMKIMPPQPNLLIWKAQAQYRLGDFDGARATMISVKNIFGKNSPAEYYLKLFDSRPDSVEYAIDLPYSERMTRFKQIHDFLEMTPAEAYIEFNDPMGNLREVIDWAFCEGGEKMKLMLVEKFASIKCDETREFLRAQLIKDGLSFEMISRMLTQFLLVEGKRVELNVVAQNRFKKIRFVLPNAYFELPTTLFNAVSYCISDIVYTDETPNVFLHRLTMIVNSLIDKDADGNLVFDARKKSKISRLTSMRTLVGVILQKVYEDDEENSREDTIERYSITPRTFDKYMKIVFGVDDDGE